MLRQSSTLPLSLAMLKGWGCREPFLELRAMVLLQVPHIDPLVPAKSFCIISLSQGGNGLAPHHLSGALQGLWQQQVLPR